ncbi:MAG TPA: patatin-like phospholipase family protein [Phycisphaerales bacterium]|nr:patatin-like phospholipase family protein [Phycisphaerales bacterium]
MLSEKPRSQSLKLSKQCRFSSVKRGLSVVTGHFLPSRNAVPVDRMFEADLKGIKGARAWDGLNSQMFKDDVAKTIHQEYCDDFLPGQDGDACYNMLALSGGGANGAFGAGFLYGWTEAGTRPEFKLITGISSGAIIASLAFVGSDYDEMLKEIYTTVATANIFNTRKIMSLIWNESFADVGPLKRLIEKYANESSINAVAKEHAKGRRLYLGTTNLDAQRLMIWNMGVIANSGHPDTLELFRKVLLASLSVPCIFPPVYFDVEVDGQSYDEMHVDGGVVTDAFICDFMLELPAAQKKEQNHGSSIYVIRNDKLMPSPEQISRNLPKITRRALATLNKAHGEDHLHYMYLIARQNNIDFNYIGIPEECAMSDKLKFDRKKMNDLFSLGQELAMSDNTWHKKPPTLNVPD